MSKTQTLAGAAALVIAFAILTTAASAQFSGKEGAAKAGTSTFELPGTVVICNELVSIYVQQETPPQDDLINTNWEICKAKASAETVTVGCKGIQFESPEKEGTETGKATAKLLEECKAKTPAGCEVKFPTTGNQKLGKTELKKEASGVLSIVEISGVVANVNMICELGGVKGTESAKIKVPTLKQAGLALI
jgi:hypothetical protein